MADQKSNLVPISVDFHFAACFCSDLNFGEELWREEMVKGKGKMEDVEGGGESRSWNKQSSRPIRQQCFQSQNRGVFFGTVIRGWYLLILHLNLI